MKKFLFVLIVCVYSPIVLCAQGIKTSFSERIVLKDIIGYPQHTFYSGENVTLHAYKKKGGRHYFLVETEDYATIFNSNNIPFYVDEKDLKKLPSAISNAADALLKESQQAVYQRQVTKEHQLRLKKEKAEAEAKAQYRIKALNGQVRGTLSGYAQLLEDEKGLHPFSDSETVSIIGYSQVGNTHNYAMYSDKRVSIVHSRMPRNDMFRDNENIEFDKLPNENDLEVKLVLERQSNIVDSLNAIRYAEANRKKTEYIIQQIQEYKNNQPFIIDEISWRANSVGGIYVSLDFLNCTNQTIKYVIFQGHLLNAVGDKCVNEIDGSTIWKARGVGPIGPCPTTIDNNFERFQKCKASYDFDDPTFYTKSANTFGLSSVTVEYTNGRKITLSGVNLNKHVRY